LDKSNNLQPPAEWADCEGLKGTEKVQPGAHLTMFVRVSIISFIKRTHEIKICVTDSFFFLGRPLGTYGAVEDIG
jgi:hypothetical protein